jgi:hypothetical protein
MKTEAALNGEVAERNIAKSLARHVLTAERILMGIILLGCGLNGLLNVLPQSATSEGVTVFGGTLMKAGFMFPLLKGAEVLLEVYVSSACRKAA